MKIFFKGIALSMGHKLLFLFLALMCLLNVLRLIEFDRRADMPLDMRQLYFGAKVLSTGENPYNDHALKQMWTQYMGHNAKLYPLPGAPENYLLYPPHVVFALSFLTPVFSWNEFGNLTYLLHSILILLAGIFLVKGRSKADTLLIILLLLGFKSMLTAWILGNPLLSSFFFLTLIMVFREKMNPLLKGFLLFMAALKPTVALPFVLFFLADKQYRTMLYFVFFGLVVYGVMAWVQGLGFHLQLWQGWFRNMSEQTEVVFGPGHAFLQSNFTSLGVFLNVHSGLDFSAVFQVIYFVGLAAITLFIGKNKLDRVTGLLLLLCVAFMFGHHLYYDLILFLLAIPLMPKLDSFKRAGIVFLVLYLPWGYFTGNSPIHAVLLPVLAIFIATMSKKQLRQATDYARKVEKV